MNLESRKFILKDVRSSFSGHPINLIPEIVGDKEVYSIVNQNNEHCGYMTEEMLNTILKQNEKEDVENSIIRNSLFVDTNDGKRSNLINVNSNEEKILPKDTKLEIL